MTAKKAASKAPAKASKKAEAKETEEPQTVVQEAPEVEGEAYKAGFHGVSSDDGDYSIAAEVARLSEE